MRYFLGWIIRATTIANTFSSKVHSYFKGKSVFITGAGSGIGQATAQTFAGFGCHLILTDINEQGLTETVAQCESAAASIETHIVDVADFDAMKAMADDIHTRFNPVDVVVNNAGIALGGRFSESTVEDWNKVMDINIMGVVHGCKLFLPNMQAVKSGHVINIASIAGIVSPPNMVVYATSKFAVMGLTEGIRAEVADDNITVTAICPGLIKTNIMDNAPYFGTKEEQETLKANLGAREGSTDLVTKAIVNAIMKNKVVVPVKRGAWVMYYTKRLFPGLFNRMMIKLARKATLHRPKDV